MTEKTPYSLVTVDLDDTLWPCAPVIRLAEEALLAWLAEAAPRLVERHDQTALRTHRLALAAARPDIAHDLTRVRIESLRLLCVECGYDADLAGAAVAVFLEHRNRVTPYPDVPPALRALGVGHRLVSVTNGNAEVGKTPLAGLFHHDLTPALVGAKKPDPAMFEHALALAGATSREALHVGDDPWLDVEAARQVGMTAVWVNRDGRDWPPELAPPAAEVRDLAVLCDWLGVGDNAL